MADFLKEFKRLSNEMFSWMGEADGSPSTSYLGGQADLTPLRNRAREAIEALNDAQRAADAGKLDDTMDAIRRAKSAIDAALGGQTGPYGFGIGANYGSGGVGGSGLAGR